jgi:8-oxo-dGTP pyrophosphatase MutT (NUDIX family)
MIRRKFTLGFMDFILGKYSINNLEYIYRIFNEMTIQEKLRIMSETFDKLWFSIDYNCFDFKNNELPDDFRKKIENDYLNSKRKYLLIKNGYINKNNQYINLYQIIKNSRYNWLEQEWEFPKGKRKMNESNLDAAIREFTEETNFPEDNLDIILSDQPIIEKYCGSNTKKYKHIYFIGRANKYIDYKSREFTENQSIEISSICWMTYSEAMRAIRPYQIEKKMALTQVLKYIINTVGV